MTCQNEDKPSCVWAKTVGIMDADDSKDIIDCLHKSRTNDDPTICFFVEDSLREMRDSDECEEDREEN